MNKCVRRKFLGKLGKRILEILGVIVGFCLLVAVLIAATDWIDTWQYAYLVRSICGGGSAIGLAILVVITGVVTIRDWYKDTVRECKRECKYEERDANTSW